MDKRLLKLGTLLRDQYGWLPKNLVDPKQLELAAFKWAHDYVPIAIGTIPALTLAGWWVEHTTLVKGNQMMKQTAGKALDDAHEASQESTRPFSYVSQTPIVAPVSVTPSSLPLRPAAMTTTGTMTPVSPLVSRNSTPHPLGLR